MDLTVTRSGLERCRRVFSYSMPVEEAVETVVPDTLPDAERILCATGTAVIKSRSPAREPSASRAPSRSACSIRPRRPRGLRLSATVPLSVELDAPGVTEASLCAASITVSGVEARLLNPRKLLIRCVTDVSLCCWERSELSLATGIEGEGAERIQTLTQPVTFCPTAAVTEKSFAVTDEYQLQPGLLPLGDILWRRTELCPGSVRSVGERLVVNGSVRLGLIYAAEGSGELCSANFETEYSQMIDAGRELSSPDVAVYPMLTAEYIEPVTLAGGDRGISAEFHIVAQCVCADTVRADCLTDCYSNSLELETEWSETALTASRRRSAVTASGTVPLAAGATPTNIIRCVAVAAARRIRRRGAEVPVRRHGALRAGRRRNCQRLRARELRGGLGARRRGDGHGRAGTLPELHGEYHTGGVEARVQCELEASAASGTVLRQLDSVAVTGETDCHDRPSVTVIRAAEGDTLWSLAKLCGSTPALISALNGLEPLRAPGRENTAHPALVQVARGRPGRKKRRPGRRCAGKLRKARFFRFSP